ncbi:hypothetical protein U1Q18_023292 [Sarracenia purpurea var. burkii]
MVAAYESYSEHRSCLLLFRDMVRRGRPRPNDFTYPPLLRFCSDLEIARWLFDEMPKGNVVSWTAIIPGYARLGKTGNVLLLFDEMPERDIPSWSAVIAGCTQNGLFLEAISLFRVSLSSGRGAKLWSG